MLARLMARRVSLWSAITHGELVDAARASSRTRLPDLPLTPEEFAASKAARATLGHAIREARLRASRGPFVARPARKEDAAPPRRRWAWFAVAAGVLGGLGIAWFLLVGTPAGPLSDQARGGGGGARTVAVAPLGQSRGRTLIAPPPLVIGPIVRPTSAPITGSGNYDASADREGGGAGGGGGGGGGGVIAGPPLASPRQPSPPPATGYTRFHGRVLNTDGLPVQGVCVVIGSLDCDPAKPHTNELGYWTVDLTTQPYWDFAFKISGYREVTVRQYANGQMDVLVPDVKISRQ